jgi:hypothetical protein
MAGSDSDARQITHRRGIDVLKQDHQRAAGMAFGDTALRDYFTVPSVWHPRRRQASQRKGMRRGKPEEFDHMMKIWTD